MTSVTESTVDSFIAAWNEPDGDSRRDLLERCWAADGKFYDGHVALEGRSALDSHIGGLLRRWPDRRLEKRGWLERLGGRAGFRWIVRSPEGSALNGYAFTEVNEAGELSQLVSFDEPSATPPEASTIARLRSWAVENPLSVGTLTLLLIYLSLHLQAERFYDSFDVSPEEVGFGPVELAIRQATGVLAEFVKLGLAWSVGYLIGGVPIFYWTGIRKKLGRTDKRYLPFLVVVFSMIAVLLIAKALSGDWLLALPSAGLVVALLLLPRYFYPGSAKQRAEMRPQLVDLGVKVLLYGSLAYAAAMFFVVGWLRASSDADFVKAGGWITSTDFPWQARPVQARWSGRVHFFDLPHCSRLVYLGSANGWAVLYDQGRDSTVRLMETDASLSFPDPVACVLPPRKEGKQQSSRG